MVTLNLSCSTLTRHQWVYLFWLRYACICHPLRPPYFWLFIFPEKGLYAWDSTFFFCPKDQRLMWCFCVNTLICPSFQIHRMIKKRKCLMAVTHLCTNCNLQNTLNQIITLLFCWISKWFTTMYPTLIHL